MLRILSWTPPCGGEQNPSAKFASSLKEKPQPALPALDFSNSAKRKRSDDTMTTAPGDENAVKVSTESACDVKSVLLQTVTQSKALSPPCALQTADEQSTSRMEKISEEKPEPSIAPPREFRMTTEQTTGAKLDSIRQTISSQLSLEILVKHRELRLIDQELAKCQAALEQLRRCSEIPYPSMMKPSENVSSGRGPAVKKPSEKYPALSPAPWGVTNGPYTRHYAQWLLPDCRFDGGLPDAVPGQSTVSTPLSGRSTRGHYTDFAQLVGKTSRSQRANNHMSLPPGYAEPKQKPTGPMILKRKSDGKMVKLVCPDCGRLDFGSAQGFINHCRIGHQRNFASHDAAAEGCGDPVEYDENGQIKDVPPPPQPQQQVLTPTVNVSVNSQNVHSLVRSAKLLPPRKPLPKSSRGSKSKSKKAKHVSDSPANFQASGQIPHLSALVKDQGMGLNLAGLVAEVKMKIQDREPELDEEDAMDIDSPAVEAVGRHPQGAGGKQLARSAGKGLQGRQHRPSQAASDALNEIVSHSVDFGNVETEFRAGLLPSPTNESTQAPSLIDDDEEMEPQSPSSSDENDEDEVPFHVRDEDHPEEVSDLRGHELPTPPGTCAPPTPAQPMRPQSAFSDAFDSDNSQPLRFVSSTTLGERDVDGDKKRRKVMG